MSMAANPTKSVDQLSHQDTIYSLNFFIFLIAMVPADEKNGLIISMAYTI